MTRTAGKLGTLDELSALLKAQKSKVAAVSRGRTQYVIDPTTGNAVAIIGNISSAPTNVPGGNYTGTPQVVSTGLSGTGIAVYVSPLGTAEPTWTSGGSWVQLPTSGTVWVITGDGPPSSRPFHPRVYLRWGPASSISTSQWR